MNLYITSEPGDSMSGVRIEPAYVNNKSAHLVIASSKWKEAYVDVTEEIHQGMLVYLYNQCETIYPRVPEHPTRHQMILLTELFPELAGKLRKAFMKGDSVYGILPQVWKHGAPGGRDPLQLPTP